METIRQLSEGGSGRCVRPRSQSVTSDNSTRNHHIMPVTWYLFALLVFNAYAATQTRSSQIKIISCLAGMDEHTIRNQSHMALHLNGLDSRYQLNIKIPSSAGVCTNWQWLAGAKPTDEALIVIDRADDDNRLADIVLRPSDVDLTSIRLTTVTTYDADVRTADAAADYLDYFGWKSAVIFSSEDLKWKSLADHLELTLRRRSFAVKYPVQIVTKISNESIGKVLTSGIKAIFVCGSLDSSWSSFLTVVNATRFSIRQSAAMLTFRPIINGFIRPDPLANMLEKLILFVISSTDHRAQLGAFQKRDARQQGLALDRIYESVALTGSLLERNISGVVSITDTFDPPDINNTIEIQLANQQMAEFSLQESDASHWTAIRHIRPVLLQWLPDQKRYMHALQLEKNGTDLTIVRTINHIRWPNIFVQASEYCDVTVDCYLSEPNGGNRNAVMAIVVAVIIGAFVTATLVLVIRWRFQKNLAVRGPNKILFTTEDVVLPVKLSSDLVRPDLIRASSSSITTLANSGNIRRILPASSDATNGTPAPRIRSPILDSVARYNGELIHLRYLLVSPLEHFEIKSKAVAVLSTLRSLRHENVNMMMGCFCHETNPALLFEYCSRGSLNEILRRQDLSLDWTFQLSLLTDLVRGMRYLHNSCVQYHGRLTSHNCVVDSRWVLKITDYGIPLFYHAQGIDYPNWAAAKDWLWTAPEILRSESGKKAGSPQADVYSFSIIVSEVLTHDEPFAMFQMEPREILRKLKKPPPLIRPSVSKGSANPELIEIMRQCWSEAPESRPDFNTIHDTFKKFNQGKKSNIVDTMFEMIERYSNHLEDLIRERTEELDMERKKTEQLLNRMLPSSVADKLKLGLPVEPEQFDEVTIYFSDIVGFTTLSAYSTPIEIVTLLNDLYTCFDATIHNYTVYKVETIGDAYMVVGGLPVRSNDHAEQVATMALDLLHQSGQFRIRHLPDTPVHLRIGIHTGMCCAGVVGLTMPRFCLFGDTVNTASRMESTGAPWRIHLSWTTHDKLEEAGGYQMQFRGMTELKGKGNHPTYWLLGKDGFNKSLPIPPEIGSSSHGLDESILKRIKGRRESGGINMI